MSVDDEAALDIAFELLADRRRRAVVSVLRTVPSGSLDLSTLVDAVSTECGDGAEAVASLLYHRHLPKLDDAGVVEFDREEREVVYNSHPLIERCLDVAETYRSDGWVTRSSDSS